MVFDDKATGEHIRKRLKRLQHQRTRLWGLNGRADQRIRKAGKRLLAIETRRARAAKPGR